jgi:hypothetical protein
MNRSSRRQEGHSHLGKESQSLLTSAATKRQLKSNQESRVVFMFDVDNTLLDNDRVTTGKSSNNCGSNSATPTIWARYSGIAANILTTFIC